MSEDRERGRKPLSTNRSGTMFDVCERFVPVLCRLCSYCTIPDRSNYGKHTFKFALTNIWEEFPTDKNTHTTNSKNNTNEFKRGREETQMQILD